MNYTQPDYEIQLEGGKIPLLFTSWTFREFSLRNGVEFEDLINRINEGRPIVANQIPDLLLIAAKAYCFHNKVEFQYDEADAFMWIDELGGLNSMKLADIIKVYLSRLLKIPEEKFDVAMNNVKEPPKKKVSVKPSLGSGSTQKQPQPV
jgi:hypothetical protein